MLGWRQLQPQTVGARPILSCRGRIGSDIHWCCNKKEVGREMPVQRRSTPTLAGVARQIKAFEVQYCMSSAEFVGNEDRAYSVDEDDAMQWLYLIEQLSALQEAAVGTLYSTVYDSGPLQNSESSPELLAA